MTTQSKSKAYPRGGHVRAQIRDATSDYRTERWYPSLQAMMETVCSEENKTSNLTEKQGLFNKSGRGYQSGSSHSWTLGIGCVGAYRDLVEKGWQEGLDRVRSSLKALRPQRARTIRRKRVRGDYGDHLDIHRVYAGTIENAWDRLHRGTRHGPKVVTIWCHISTTCMYSAEQMFWRGAATMAITESLEVAGYRVRIVGVYANDDVEQEARQTRHHRSYDYEKLHGKSSHMMCVEIKAAQQTIAKANLAAIMCHPATTRVLGFMHLMGMPFRIASYMGMPKEQPLDLRPGDIEVRKVWDREAAQEAVDKALRPYA